MNDNRGLPKMYLAGPITGLTYNECSDWRKHVTVSLVGKVHCLSPTRAKEYLNANTKISKCYEGCDWFKSAMSGPRGIMSRDYWDCNRCDILFVNFQGAVDVSIGTCMEIAWAYSRKIPIVCVLDELHSHAMLEEAITHKVETVDQGIEVVRALL